jgi:hypothetical protein
MRKFFLIASAAASMFAVGCVSPESVCESGVATTCDKVFECSAAELKASDTFKAFYGTSADDCKTKLTALAKCSERKDYDEACTGDNAGKTYDLGNASDCSDGIKDLSCNDYNAGKYPAVCAQICK